MHSYSNSYIPYDFPDLEISNILIYQGSYLDTLSYAEDKILLKLVILARISPQISNEMKL